MLRLFALVLGIGLALFGLAGIAFYVVGVVDIVINRPPDQSWLFWGIPLATIGATALLTGVGLLILWRHLGRNENRTSSAP